MKIAMMQPAFLPWQGFFALIKKADLFIFLDDFQFSVQSYHQRNKLLTDFDSEGWYTVPVKKKEAFQKAINEVYPNDATNWKVKAVKRIQQNYSKCPFYEPVFEIISNTLELSGSLSEINVHFIKQVTEYLGWKTEFKYSSELDVEGVRSDRVISILDAVGATEYLSARGAFGYMHEDGFTSKTDINPMFLNYISSPYEQMRTESFIPNLSIADALFNIGPDATSELIIESTSWLSWQEMYAHT